MNLFQAVKEKLRIATVVGEYTTLKHVGAYLKSHCPFHHERTASFTVTPDREIFYCFGCKAGGDIIVFISTIEKCTPREAALHLIERYKLSITLDGIDKQYTDSWGKQRRYTDVCSLVADWCHEQLKLSPNAQGYMKTRGISRASIEQFSIGYFPSGELSRRKLLSLLQKQGFLLDDLMEMRFLLRNEQRSSVYSPFEDRIIFPIRDHIGRVCGFGGRVFLEGDDRPKYYNSHDHAQFTKSSLLFGLDGAKREIQKTGNVYLVEGYIDAVMMAQSGTKNVIATLGTACSEEHITLISRYAHRITIMYDGDGAGFQATMRIGELCWDHTVELYVTTLPADKDPADFLLHGGELSQLAHHDVFTFYIESIKTHTQAQSLTEKLRSLRNVIQRIARISNRLTRDILMQQLSQASHIPLTTLMYELQATTQTLLPTNGAKRAPSLTPTHSIAHPVPCDPFAGQLFCTILTGIHTVTAEDLEAVLFCLPPQLQAITQQLVTLKDRQEGSHFSDFFGTLSQEDQEYVQRILAQYGQALPGSPITEEGLREVIGRCRTKRWKATIQRLQEDIAAAQRCRDYDTLHELLREFAAIKQSL